MTVGTPQALQLIANALRRVRCEGNPMIGATGANVKPAEPLPAYA